MKASEELKTLKAACPVNAPSESCSTLRVLIEDYGALRAQIRAMKAD